MKQDPALQASMVIGDPERDFSNTLSISIDGRVQCA